MKKLINKKTGEVAIIDLSLNTITFSKSKTTHKICIQKDSSTRKITKITTFTKKIQTPKEIKSELTSKTNTKPTSNPINYDLNINSNNPEIEIIDDFSKYEMIPETEIFYSPYPHNPNLLIPTYKITA